ncbi:MAG TPA: redoxin domain-containing protein [Blastocatellia bacterium]|nr:redoxin domain-containing protein [Blastocatellia bacterium]
MKRVALFLFVGLAFFASAKTGSQAQASAVLTVGAAAPEFELNDLSGQPHSLTSYRGKPTVIAFISARCPISNLYKDRIKAVADEYTQRGVNFIAINSSADESVDEVRAHANENNFKFTILKDEGNVVADAYAAERTPKVYVLDGEGVLRYRGRIDNSQNIRLVKQNDLRAALDELLSGKPVTVADTQAMGCIIKRAQDLAQSKTAKPAAGKPATATKPAPGKPATGTKPAAAATGSLPAIAPLKPAAFANMLKQRAGNVVVVNFWATWCGPCVAEFPEFVKLDNEYKAKGGVRFVHITADDMTDLKKAATFLKEQKSNADQFIQDTEDPQEMIDVVFKDWQGVLPATFVYDKTGKMIFHRLGIIDRDVLIAEIEKALKQ